MFLIFFLYALCASSFTIAKAVLEYSPPIFFVAVRMFAAGLLLLGWLRLRGVQFSIARRDWWLFANIILFHIYFAYIFDLWSLQYMPSFKSSFFFNLSPFITAIISYLMFSERITTKKIVGMIVGFLGFIPMIVQQSLAEGQWGELLSFSWPEVGLLAAITSSCLGWTSMKKLLTYGAYSPLFVNGFGMVGGGLLAFATSYATESWDHGPVSQWKPFLLLTGAIIVVCNIVFYNLYGFLLTRYSATLLSFAGATTPLLAALFGVIFLGEVVTWHFFVSAAIVGFGLYLFYQEELRQGVAYTR